MYLQLKAHPLHAARVVQRELSENVRDVHYLNCMLIMNHCIEFVIVILRARVV